MVIFGVTLWLGIYSIFLATVGRHARGLGYRRSWVNPLNSSAGREFYPTLFGVLIWGGLLVFLIEFIAATAQCCIEIKNSTFFTLYMVLTILFVPKYLIFYLKGRSE